MFFTTLEMPTQRDASAAKHDTPRRGNQRAQAAKNQAKAAEQWKFGDREGNMPIPVGSIVTVGIDKVDRGPCDARRYSNTYCLFHIFIHIYFAI
jgi:hypothetical protein